MFPPIAYHIITLTHTRRKKYCVADIVARAGGDQLNTIKLRKP